MPSPLRSSASSPARSGYVTTSIGYVSGAGGGGWGRGAGCPPQAAIKTNEIRETAHLFFMPDLANAARYRTRLRSVKCDFTESSRSRESAPQERALHELDEREVGEGRDREEHVKRRRERHQ